MTSLLTPDAAYTVWWVIFNYPEHCVDGCGPDDLGNVDAKTAAIYATGGIADGN